MNYYERHLGDYARDTGHLSPLEHGIYNLLLDRYYATELPIPADQAYRICRARTKEEREAVDAVLVEFFSLEEGVYRQGRVEGEIEKAHARIDSARSNGKRGGRPKKNPPGSETETQQKPNGLSLGSSGETGLKALQTPDSIHHKDQELSSSAKPNDPPADLDAKRKERAERLSAITADAITAYNSILAKPLGLLAAVSLKVGREKRRDQVAKCLRVVRQICDENYGSTIVTPEFWKDYFTECAGDDFLRGAGPYSGSHANWRPDFEFLTREATVLKVYDRATAEDAA